jgi:hypothetical protein
MSDRGMTQSDIKTGDAEHAERLGSAQIKSELRLSHINLSLTANHCLADLYIVHCNL